MTFFTKKRKLTANKKTFNTKTKTIKLGKKKSGIGNLTEDEFRQAKNKEYAINKTIQRKREKELFELRKRKLKR